MTPTEKAKELLEKMNNGKISKALWDNCSEYARNDLKRKAMICVDEIYALDDLKVGRFEGARDISMYYSYWEDVKTELEKL